MIEIDTDNAIAFLADLGHVPNPEGATVEWLSWGVSNCVLRVHSADGLDMVVKQSRRQLRTEVAWFSQLERIWREVEVLRYLSGVLPSGAVPAVIFEDREQFLFGMQAVDGRHTVWKADLLAGCCDTQVARLAGRYLGLIHCRSAGQPELQTRWGDVTVFRELRLDPFYRYVAQHVPRLHSVLHDLIDDTLSRSVCLVLADFSPKNILVTDGQITLVDFETAHYGDPAFDLGFLISHLFLKTILHLDRQQQYRQVINDFWSEYLQVLSAADHGWKVDLSSLERRSVLHLGACLLARIDGTSPIDYLREPPQVDLARRIGHQILLQPVARFDSVLDLLSAG